MSGVFITTPLVVVDVVILALESMGAAVDDESDLGEVRVLADFWSGLTSIWRWLVPRAVAVWLLGLSAGSEWEGVEPLGETVADAWAGALSRIETLGGLALPLAVAFPELAVAGFCSAALIMPTSLLKSNFVGFMIVSVRKSKKEEVDLAHEHHQRCVGGKF